MKSNLIKILAVGSLVAGSVIVGTGDAQAAALTGELGFNSGVIPVINPILPPGATITIGGYAFSNNSPGGITLDPITQDAGDFLPKGVPPLFNTTGNVVFDPNGKPITTFNFHPDPSSNDPVGSIIQISGTGSFSTYNNHYGLIKDIQESDAEKFLAKELGKLLSTDFGFNSYFLDDFITVYQDDLSTKAFTFDLESISLPEYSSDTAGTTVSVGFFGTFKNELDGSLSKGQFTGSLDFVGLSETDVIGLLRNPNDPYTSLSYSANGIASVPESSPVSALIGFGLVGSAFALKRKVKVN